MNEIDDYFEETAHNESAHAKVWFKALHGGDISATSKLTFAMQQLVKTMNTPQCTKDFADEAEKEGLHCHRFQMREVGKIEARHEAVTLH